MGQVSDVQAVHCYVIILVTFLVILRADIL